METEVINISLSELSEIEGLTVRTQNVCEDNKLNNLSLILNYYWAFNNFLRLRNCGAKSNLELIDICNKYKSTFIKPTSDIVRENLTIDQKIDLLTISQKAIINNFITAQFDELSIRGSNALKACLGANIDLIGIRWILSDIIRLRNLPHVGEKTVVELNVFINKILNQIDLLLNDEYETSITDHNYHNLNKIDTLTIKQKAILSDQIHLFSIYF